MDMTFFNGFLEIALDQNNQTHKMIVKILTLLQQAYEHTHQKTVQQDSAPKELPFSAPFQQFKNLLEEVKRIFPTVKIFLASAEQRETLKKAKTNNNEMVLEEENLTASSFLNTLIYNLCLLAQAPLFSKTNAAMVSIKTKSLDFFDLAYKMTLFSQVLLPAISVHKELSSNIALLDQELDYELQSTFIVTKENVAPSFEDFAADQTQHQALITLLPTALDYQKDLTLLTSKTVGELLTEPSSEQEKSLNELLFPIVSALKANQSNLSVENLNVTELVEQYFEHCAPPVLQEILNKMSNPDTQEQTGSEYLPQLQGSEEINSLPATQPTEETLELEEKSPGPRKEYSPQAKKPRI